MQVSGRDGAAIDCHRPTTRRSISASPRSIRCSLPRPQVWGNKVLGLVLTGMGSDGLHGGEAIVDAGGAIVAQDEATSVVWGMPGQVALHGLCSAVLPLNDIAPKLTKLFAGDRP